MSIKPTDNAISQHSPRCLLHPQIEYPQIPQMPRGTHDSNISKRRRIVEGLCWPCKQRRIKCDLRKASCRRYVASNSESCSYGKVLVHWKQHPAKGIPAIQPAISDGLSLAVSGQRARSHQILQKPPLASPLDCTRAMPASGCARTALTTSFSSALRLCRRASSLAEDGERTFRERSARAETLAMFDSRSKTPQRQHYCHHDTSCTSRGSVVVVLPRSLCRLYSRRRFDSVPSGKGTGHH